MNIHWFQRLGLCLIAAAAVGSPACGGDGGATDSDAGGVIEATRLVVLDPPGDSIGLAFGGMVTLRVRYERADGRPIVGEEVAFSVVVGGEEASGGATLSTTSATTNGAGIATTELAAGSERVMFRIAANAPNAPPAFFYVGVSADGFANLVVTPRHEGFRDPGTFARIELRMFRASTLICAALDIDNLPESTFPPRSASSFDEPLTYANVTVGIGYTVVAWAVGSLTETPLAAGCTDLGTAYLPPTFVEIDPRIRDREPALVQTALRSQLDLTAAYAAGGRTWAWEALACPTGPGQLAFDCLADVAAADGLLDCKPQALVPPFDAAIRGPLDGNGCRPALAGGERSVDDELTEVLLAGPLDAATLATIVNGRKLLTANLRLLSELTRSGQLEVEHVLRRAEFELGATTLALELPDTTRPLLAASAIPYAVAGNWATIGVHSFTLRPGALLRAAVETLLLMPAGITAGVESMGSALIEDAFHTPSSTAGCMGVSAALCRHLGVPDNCALAACTAGAAALDSQLAAAFTGVPASGIDLTLDGQGPLYDGDEDLIADRYGSDKPGAQPGTWKVTLPIDGADPISITASFRTP